MNCPVCKDVTLVMSDKQGIEVDYCPQCRGVWLDRGELDKIVERSLAGSAPPPPPRASQSFDTRSRPPRDDDDDDRDRYRDSRPKRKKSFLGDLFDFD